MDKNSIISEGNAQTQISLPSDTMHSISDDFQRSSNLSKPASRPLWTRRSPCEWEIHRSPDLSRCRMRYCLGGMGIARYIRIPVMASVDALTDGTAIGTRTSALHWRLSWQC
jgi:hypothetical protein